ncbi:MAG: glycoside hydrolase family 130 protein [Candidatus Sumerlaeia bacterium]
MVILTGKSTSSPIRVKQLPIKLDRDIRRVVTLPFNVSATANVSSIVARVDSLSDELVTEALSLVYEGFSQRHEKMESQLLEHYEMACHITQRHQDDSHERKLLIGAYFTMEYSVEAAALFNPSIVPHPDQSDVPPGGKRFIMSLRAVGEGHISSTVFQTGLVTKAGAIALDPPDSFATRTRIKPDHHYLKSLFSRKLEEMGVNISTAWKILDLLPDEFTLDELENAIAEVKSQGEELPQMDPTTRSMVWLARANYELQLDKHDTISDLILFPRSDNEQRGIEDMRLVHFTEDDGEQIYYGTYTAFDGYNILAMLMETRDFRTINMHTLNGACVQNKGMALFPRKINGHYAMCSRIDGHNLFLMFSDYVHFWESATLLAEPKFPWELRIMGNCGSPLETDEGWLLITHGVGPMRRYCIGAMLLDLDDPFKIRGRLKHPLLEPSEDDREGYVPNVVYSCGSMIHNGKLILPYAVSDTATRMSMVDVDELVRQLIKDGP